MTPQEAAATIIGIIVGVLSAVGAIGFMAGCMYLFTRVMK